MSRRESFRKLSWLSRRRELVAKQIDACQTVVGVHCHFGTVRAGTSRGQFLVLVILTLTSRDEDSETRMLSFSCSPLPGLEPTPVCISR